MDKIMLNNLQLKQLVHFIKSRGFKQPHVIVEILDHFACKVEEIMNEHPSLQFEDVVELAHRKFGVSGFYPLVSTYYEAQRKKYASVLWQEVKRIFTSPFYLTALVIIYAICYKGGILFSQYFNGDWINVNTFYYTIYITILCSLYFTLKTKYVKNNIIQTLPAWFAWIPIESVFIISTFQTKHTFTHVTFHIYTLLIVLLLIRQICYYKIIRMAQQEITIANECYDTIAGNAISEA